MQKIYINMIFSMMINTSKNNYQPNKNNPFTTLCSRDFQNHSNNEA